ncbi:MarR family winged helix-turn-helix transcriptional regulator [Actinophytocola sp.]|uniref:MarR family winged helix-turn-helix transcriptional regulator n=1 Tax=Actinophytocola sp. TaxID=1872138 RepID=UPI002D7E1E0C|nr:MarR family transcriptional regulator [Actinophytocola sp.]HET9141766.1 MarR family transcriptional regulator [Actinophytocola sp.]
MTPGYLLWRVTMKWRAAVERAVAPLGLTHAQYTLLASLTGLSHRGQRPSQRELADVTGLDQVYVSKLARALERSGFIERAGHPTDPRAVQLHLTERGSEVVTRAVAIVAELLEELTAPLGGTASRQTNELTTMLRALLGEPRPTEGDERMTQPTTLFGQDLGIASRAGSRLLYRILDAEAVSFEEWITLKLVHDQGGHVPRETLVAGVAGGLDADPPAIGAVVGGLESRGVLREADGGLGLTAAGRALFDRLLDATTRSGEEILSGLPAEDVATTRRILNEFTARVNRTLSTADGPL